MIRSICTRFGLAALCALSATPLRAQPGLTPEESPWIQVEVIVFRQLDSGSAADEEWPAEPELRYPDEIHILDAGEASAESAAEAKRSSEASLLPTAAPGNVAGPPHTAELEQTDVAEELPFLLLPPEQLFLQDLASKLQRSGDYGLLAHTGWRQPMPPYRERSNVLILGGQPHEDHFELEGYVSISRTRFMHASTRLWLNEFVPPLDDASGRSLVSGGPELPPIPQPPPEPEDTGTDPDLDQITAGDGMVGALADGDGIGTTPAVQTTDSATEKQQSEPPQPAPRSARTLLLREKRRVKLGEIHYFDHPFFGAIIAVRRYDPQSSADTEAGVDSAD